MYSIERYFSFSVLFDVVLEDLCLLWSVIMKRVTQ